MLLFSANLDTLETVEVVYKTMPGWKESLSNVRNYNDLPGNAKTYIKFIEDYLDVPGNDYFPFLNCFFKLEAIISLQIFCLFPFPIVRTF